MRACSKVHVEYEVFKHLMDKIDLSDLEEKMVLQHKGDQYYSKLEKRWEDGVNEVASMINNKIEKRLHRLPKKHPAYMGKGE